MEAIMQFVQIDDEGRPEPLEVEPIDDPIPLDPPWSGLRERALKLLSIRS
jgi:hypothetical protein